MILDRTKPPKTSEILTPRIPEYQQLTIGKNIDLITLNQGSQPLLLLDIELPCGRFTEHAPGVTYYLAKMLTEGTQTKSSEQIAETFDFYGSHLEIIPTLDSISIKLYCLKKFFPELLALLKEMLTDSIFPEKELETLKRIRVQQIKQQNARNNAFAGLKFREQLFGSTHPYGLIIDEKVANSVDRSTIMDAQIDLFKSPTIYLGGMIDDDDIQLVEQSLGVIFNDQSPAQKQYSIVTGANQTITKEDSTQASLRQGHLTISKDDKEIHKLKITNTLLGGFFGSRLMKNIREEKGLTYGIHSAFAHLKEASYWFISTEILKEKLDLAKSEIINEVEKLRKNAPTIEELNVVTNYSRGKFLNSFDSAFSSLHMIKTLKSSNLDLDYYESYLEELATITPETISKTAADHFRIEDMLEISIT